MSAHTRRLLERFDALSHSARDLMTRHLRSGIASEEVLKALQLYKEGIPFVCFRRDSEEGQRHSREHLQDFLSVEIRNIGFTSPAHFPTQKYCKKHGARLLGEVHQLPWTRPSEAETELKKYLRSWGFDPDTDPTTFGWIPPYWKESGFLEFLDTPIEIGYPESPEADARRTYWYHRLWSAGCDTLGCALKYAQSQGPGALEALQKRLSADFQSRFPFEIHACMYVPSDWTQPTEVPPRAAEYRTRAEEHRGEAQRDQERREELRNRGDIPGRMVTEEDRENLRRSTESLDLLEDTIETFRALGVQTIEDLVPLGEKDLIQRSKQPGKRPFGQKTIKYLKWTLADMNLSLRMSFPDGWVKTPA